MEDYGNVYLNLEELIKKREYLKPNYHIKQKYHTLK